MFTQRPHRPFVVSTLVITMTLLALCVTTPSNAADEKRAVNWFEQLVGDVLPIRQKSQELAALDSAPDEVAAVTARKPRETHNWQDLRIGEFESNEAFKRRQEQAQQQEAKASQTALETWERELAAATEHRAAQTARRAVLVKQDVTPKLAARSLEKPIGAIIGFRQKPTLALPYFDRTHMIFDHVRLPATVAEVGYQGSNTVLGRFNTSPVDLRIKIGDLPAAQKFKEDVAAGKITFAVWVEPWLASIESPIVTAPARNEREVDKGAVAQSAFQYLIVIGASALGADPNAVNQGAAVAGDDVAHRDHHKIVHYPAETRDGVRFYFDLDTVMVVAVDESGKQLPGVEVEFTDRPTAAVRFTGLRDDAQPAAKVLKQWDEILAVAGKKVRNADDCIAAIKAQPSGVTFTVSYRAVDDGHEHTFVAAGGRMLGISLIDVYPDNRIRIGN